LSRDAKKNLEKTYRRRKGREGGIIKPTSYGGPLERRLRGESLGIRGSTEKERGSIGGSYFSASFSTIRGGSEEGGFSGGAFLGEGRI